MPLPGSHKRKGQPFSHPDTHKPVSCFECLLLDLEQPGNQESALTLKSLDQPEANGVGNHIPADLLIPTKCLYLPSQCGQPFCIAASEKRPRLKPGSQETETPPD